jgi:hypothetical protein
MNPSSRWEIMTFYRLMRLAESKDAWVGSGLREPTGKSGSNLGSHFEARIRYELHKYIQLEGGYAHFFKGPYLDRLPDSPRTPDSDFVYLEIEVRAPLLR